MDRKKSYGCRGGGGEIKGPRAREPAVEKKRRKRGYDKKMAKRKCSKGEKKKKKKEFSENGEGEDWSTSLTTFL